MSNDLKKRGLGRGLGALIMNTSGETAPNGVDVAHARTHDNQTAGVATLAIGALSPNPHQPRAYFAADTLAELADSIHTHGIIQPLVVTAVPDHPGRYWIVAGERRWRAATLAGLDSVPAVIREASPQQLMEWALVENIQRDDLNPLEEAHAYQALIEDFSLTQADVAARVGKSRSAVANTVRLLNLPPEAQQAIIDGQITAGHARALLALPDAAAMVGALSEILRRQLSVRETELLVKRLLEAPPVVAKPAPDPALQAHFAYLEDRFRAALGTKVSLNRNEDGSGRLVVHFYSDDDLEAIYQLLADPE